MTTKNAANAVANTDPKIAPFGLISSAVLLDKRFGSTELRVYAVLAVHADRSRCVRGLTRARILEICGFSGSSEGNISKVIGRLADWGYVRVQRVGYKRPNNYYLLDVKATADNENLRTITDRRLPDDVYQAKRNTSYWEDYGFLCQEDMFDYENRTGLYADEDEYQLKTAALAKRGYGREQRYEAALSAAQRELSSSDYSTYTEYLAAAIALADSRLGVDSYSKTRKAPKPVAVACDDSDLAGDFSNEFMGEF